MALRKTKNKNMTKDKFVPFEKENVVRPLKMFISIVPQGQAEGIIKIFEDLGANYSFISNGEGTGKNFMPGLITDNKKQIVFSFIKEEKSKEVCEVLKRRFSVSKTTAGISLSVKLTSVAGVSVYRFLTNTRKVKKAKKDE